MYLEHYQQPRLFLQRPDIVNVHISHITVISLTEYRYLPSIDKMSPYLYMLRKPPYTCYKYLLPFNQNITTKFVIYLGLKYSLYCSWYKNQYYELKFYTKLYKTC